jgi:hypothetical protein
MLGAQHVRDVGVPARPELRGSRLRARGVSTDDRDQFGVGTAREDPRVLGAPRAGADDGDSECRWHGVTLSNRRRAHQMIGNPLILATNASRDKPDVADGRR